MVTPTNLWILNVELGSCHSSGVCDFKVLPTLMGDLSTCDIEPVLISFRFNYSLWFDGSCLFTLLPGAAAKRGPWPPHSWGFLITHNDASLSVGLLWTSDQLVADTSTWQHTTLTTDKHPCPQWDSSPRSQQASSRSPTPCNARPLRHRLVPICTCGVFVFT